jgi:hypothetical protein
MKIIKLRNIKSINFFFFFFFKKKKVLAHAGLGMAKLPWPKWGGSATPTRPKSQKKKKKKKGLWGLALRGGQISFALAL